MQRTRRWPDGSTPACVRRRRSASPSTCRRDPVTVLRDQYGNALGGVRIPDVTVPTALNTGTNSGGKGATSAGACAQAGTWVPFTNATLASLYTSHEDYVQKVQDAARTSVQQGFLLQEDADRLVAEARLSDVLRVDGQQWRDHRCRVSPRAERPVLPRLGHRRARFAGDGRRQWRLVPHRTSRSRRGRTRARSRRIPYPCAGSLAPRAGRRNTSSPRIPRSAGPEGQPAVGL